MRPAAVARRTGPARDRGSVSVEVAVLLPAFLLLIVLATVVGRLAVASNAVTAAAQDAARAASISRDRDTAEERARTVATETLAAQGLHCRSPQVRPDTSQFALPVGTPATVRVTVTCEVTFADVVFAGLPGTRTVSATFVSPIDTWRGRR